MTLTVKFLLPFLVSLNQHVGSMYRCLSTSLQYSWLYDPWCLAGVQSLFFSGIFIQYCNLFFHYKEEKTNTKNNKN